MDRALDSFGILDCYLCTLLHTLDLYMGDLGLKKFLIWTEGLCATDTHTSHHITSPKALKMWCFVVRNEAGEEVAQELDGRWCFECRKAAEAKRTSLRDAFFLGSNTTCRGHLKAHWTLYEAKCIAAKLEPSHYAMPADILAKRKAAEESLKKAKQRAQLTQISIQDAVGRIPVAERALVFDRAEVVKAVTQYIVAQDVWLF
ncbi:hypothetical protein SISNIDRAFT_463997 [Sistotremastrum niveocremeum HHB9708]|uniref:Uncharacterized protein n=1 Tax=Sistotremastrum niveocremeum HHB9708 TaxID=1314777 RepID=A0A164Y2W0_9AGAM|nr:hypothetical protein SISNIDRAFT_463997 [Sistotremastrum niveocremeum HHB9708]